MQTITSNSCEKGLDLFAFCLKAENSTVLSKTLTEVSVFRTEGT